MGDLLINSKQGNIDDNLQQSAYVRDIIQTMK